MSAAELEQRLASLFQEAGPAHHQAYLATNGDDPEWPLWYAEFLHGRLTGLLPRPMTRSELVHFLVEADRSYRAARPAEPWPPYYARLLLERLG